MAKGPVVFLFNAPLSSGCDYVTQTLRLVSKSAQTYGVALGDVISLRQLLFDKNIWITKRIYGVKIIRPVSILPGLRFRIVRNISYAVTCILLRFVLGARYFGQKKTVWFFEPFHIMELLWVFTGYRSIYDCVDYYPGFSLYAKLAHEKLLRKATYVFVNSTTLQNTLKEIRPDTKLVPLGFANDLFMSANSKQLKNKIFTVGYVGSISARLDFRLLIDSARLMPHVRFVFVGPFERDVFGKEDAAQKEFKELLSYSNIEWIKEIPKNMIPNTIAGFDACMIPYDISNVFNRYSFPMKTMEYFSLGKPVITTPIEELKRFPELVEIGYTANDWVRCIDKTSSTKWPSHLKKRQLSIPRDNSWERKVSEIIKHCDV
jgi:glycosyltransferase involved in cell wall biosynthesis